MSLLKAARFVRPRPQQESRLASLDLLLLASTIKPPSYVGDAVARREELTAYMQQLKSFKQTAAKVLDAARTKEKAEQQQQKQKSKMLSTFSTRVTTVVIPAAIGALTTVFSFMATTVVRVCAFAMSMVWSAVAGAISFLLANPAVALAAGLLAVAYGGYKYFQHKSESPETQREQVTQQYEVYQPTSHRPAVVADQPQAQAKPLSVDTPKVKKSAVGGDVKDAIHRASQVVGVPVSLLTAMAGVESAFRTDAGASTSSAKGLFQFIGSTWSGVLAKYGPKYGVAPNASRFDPVASAIMAAAMMKHEGYPAAKAAVNNPSMTDIYLTHFLGPTGGRKFIQAYMANPNDYGINAVKANQAQANYNVFYDKSGQPKTLAQIYNAFASKLGAWLSRGEDIVSSDPIVVAQAPTVNAQSQVNKQLSGTPDQGAQSVNSSPDYIKRGKQILKVENGLSSA